MCCGIAILGILGPRAAIIFWWLLDPARWAVTFNNDVLLPALGFVFLPWTTIMYVFFWMAGGLSGLGLIFVLLGLLADLGTYGGGVFGNKDQVQGYTK